jgi:hemolysin activation/secretion protein
VNEIDKGARARHGTGSFCLGPIRAIAVCSAMACLPLSSLAQTPPINAAPPPSPEQVIQEGLRRQEQRTRDQQKALEPKADELVPDGGKRIKPEFPQESACFVVNELSLDGKDAARFAWLADAAMPYLRRCVGVKGLSFIAGELDAKLRELGFATTRVSLPPQNLQSGRLSIHVEAGRVSDIRMVRADGAQKAPTAPDEAWGTWRNAFPVSPGDIVDVRDLEQGVENMKRLPSQAVATRLEPGETPGSSILFIERKAGGFRDRLRGGATIDNSGGPSLGRAQLSVNVAFDNPAGLNDVLTASLNTNAQQPTSTHRSQSASVNYSIPWGYNLLTLSTSNSRFAQFVQGTTVRFLSSGRSETAETKLQRTVWRSASTKLGLYASVSTRRAISYLDDVEVIVQRRRTTSFETGASYKHLFEHASIDLDLGYKRGMPWQGAQEDFDSAALGGLTLRPRIWTFSGSVTADFSVAGQPVQLSSHLRGQRTRNTTLSVDQISIGGRSTVRGFDGDSVLLAENGVVLRNELTTPVKLANGLDTSALFAIDYGRVWGPSDILLTGKKLAGMALGLRGRWRTTQFDATVATPLSRPAGFASRRLNLYVSLTQSF